MDITQYKNLVTDSVCIFNNVDPKDDVARAQLAHALLTGTSTTQQRYDKVLSWWKSLKLDTIDDYQTVLENFNITSTVMSNQIEGANISYHNTKLLYENGTVEGFSGSPQELMTVFNHKLLDATVMQKLVDKEPLSVQLIKEFHKILMHGCYDSTRYSKGERPGQFKVNDYAVGVSEVGAFPEEVEGLINDLVDEVNSANSKDVLKIATYFHASFEFIHPFADGNGRLGRALLNYYLMLNGHPPITIFAEDKETYYLALEVYDKTEELTNFYKFLQEQTIRTWSRHA